MVSSSRYYPIRRTYSVMVICDIMRLEADGPLPLEQGYGMATNLRKKMSNKSTLFINDVNKSACEKFVKENNSYGPIKIVDTAKDVASKAPILISMVPAAQHVKQVYLDKENGVIATTPDENRLILESSTIDVDTTREVGQAIMDAGVGRYIDAPVSVSYQQSIKCILITLIHIGRSERSSRRSTSIHDRLSGF